MNIHAAYPLCETSITFLNLTLKVKKIPFYCSDTAGVITETGIQEGILELLIQKPHFRLHRKFFYSALLGSYFLRFGELQDK